MLPQLNTIYCKNLSCKIVLEVELNIYETYCLRIKYKPVCLYYL